MGIQERAEILLSYCPDNYDLYSSHESEQECELEKCPECSVCGHKITDNYLYEIDGELYCEDCMNDRFQMSLEDYIGR
jgi:hypothetical protein